jgi:hypothetical protein
MQCRPREGAANHHDDAATISIDSTPSEKERLWKETEHRLRKLMAPYIAPHR